MIGKMGKIDDFIALFHEMISKGCIPNLIAYNTMIEALAKNRMVDKALFHEMISKGRTPNLIAYNTMIEAFAKY
ncbi:hypothetical protein AAC387_Pa02g2236 [Persea americana]